MQDQKIIIDHKLSTPITVAFSDQKFKNVFNYIIFKRNKPLSC